MKIFRKLAVVAVAALAAAAFAACGDDNSTVEPQPLPPVEPVIGQYTFDGKVYDIRHATVFFDGTSYAFVFSPLPDGGRSTYLAVSLVEYFMGQTLDVKKIYHNDDYSLVYEDPVRYYSRFRSLQSGTMYIAKNSENNFTVNLDVRLNDGTPLSMEFTGDLKSEFEYIVRSSARPRACVVRRPSRPASTATPVSRSAADAAGADIAESPYP